MDINPACEIKSCSQNIVGYCALTMETTNDGDRVDPSKCTHRLFKISERELKE